MNSLNRQETEDLIVDLYYNQKKTFRQIQQIVRKSPRDIKVILNKVEPGRSSLSIPAQAYRLFSEGKTPIDVAIILNIREPEATQFNLEYWKLSQLGILTRIYQENNGNISPLAELHQKMKAAGMSVQHVIKLLLIANNDLRSIERKCQDLKREAAEITAKNLDGARTFQQLSRDISEEYKILEQHRTSCKEERLELARLRLQKEKLDSVVRQFQDNDDGFRRIKELVKVAVKQRLKNHEYILKIAFLSIIDACRNNPVEFNILYYNLPLATSEISSPQSNHNDRYNYGLSIDEKLSYPYSNNKDNVHMRFLRDEAEKFFNAKITDLMQFYITRVEMCISESVLSQFTEKSNLNSEIVLTSDIHPDENEKS